MERALGLMCGAGVLPARMAGEARRQGWRVVAFAFEESPGLDAQADRVVPSRIVELAPVIAALADERVSAALFAGKFWLGSVLHAAGGDTVSRGIAAQAGSLSERSLTATIVATLGRLGVEVLDQRDFVGDWLGEPGCWTRRQPTAAEWDDLRRGHGLARRCAESGIGQTVVIKRGVVAAVEALEGTTAALQRGATLAGPGAVAIKAVASDNDYRFDTPTVGLETLTVAAEGGMAVLAVEARRVLLLDREAMIARADARDLALVGLDGDAGV